MSEMRHAMRFGVLSKFALVGVIAAFSFVGVKVIQSSSASTSPVDCTTAVSFLDYRGETKPDIFIGNPALGFTASRTYQLGQTVNPGKYDIYAIASDDHYTHRATSPGQDVQPQKQEQFYVKLGNARTPNPTSDFTDYYDWHTGEGDFQDDDNNIITVPPAVASSKGEFLGTINLTQATNSITFEHINLYNTTDFSPNSVIPYAVGITCSEPVVKNPKLEVDKKVDANEDGQLNDNTEQANINKPIRWVVEGKNTGEGDDTATQISDCLPVGLTYTPGSIRVIGGVQGLIAYDPATRCTRWSGSLLSGQSVTYEYYTTVASKSDFASCDAATAPVDAVCIYEATIGSNRTGSLVIEDRDSAGITIGAADFTVSKVVSVNGSAFTDSQKVATENFGQVVAWKIVAKNTGTADEPGARIVDTFPTGVSVTGATVEGATEQPTVNGQTVMWNGNLAAGQTVTLTVNTAIASLDAFSTCDNVTYSTNIAADQKCPNEVTLGVADGPVGFVPGTTKTDTANVFGEFAAELAMTKLVDGTDDDSLTTTRFTSREVVEDGTSFTWKVHLENTGDATATNVNLQDALPAGVVIAPQQSVRQTITDATGQFAVTGTTVSWTGSIEPGGTVDLEIDTIINDYDAYVECLTASQSLTDCVNTATATATNSANGQPMSGQASAAVYAEFAPVYTITKQVDGNNDNTYSDSFEEAEATAPISWTIRVTNVGNQAASFARIVDPIPAGLSLASTNGFAVADSSTGVNTMNLSTATLTNGKTAVVWNGTIPVGGFVELKLITTLADKAAFDTCNDATEGNYCRNTATAGNASSAPNEIDQNGDVSDDADVSIILHGRLTVAKDVDGNSDDLFAAREVVEPGRTFIWRVRVSNTGDSAINDAAAYDVLPEGVQIIGQPELKSDNVADDTIQVVSGTRQAVFWHAPSLAPDTSAEILISVKIQDKNAFDACDNDEEIDGTVDAVCTNPVTAGTGDTPEDYDPDTDPVTSGVTILLRPELTVSKEVDGFDADSTFTKQEQHRAGSAPVVWRVTVTNTTNVAATSVALKDAFPKGFTFVSATVTPNNVIAPAYDDATSTLSWYGRLDGMATITFLVNGTIASDEDFAQCDATDGATDSLCTNVVNVEYEYPTIDSTAPKKDTISSSAAVSNSPGTPKLELNKAVDANNDGVSAADENYVIGDTVTWTVIAKNTGDGVARNLRIVDPIVNGQQYVENTASYTLTVPGQPAKTGSVTVANGALTWTGTLPVNADLKIIFRTTIQSLQAFGNCNFADGDVKDERCTNAVNLHTNNDTTPFLTAKAQLQTKLQVVLAATGSRDTLLQIAVGTAIAAAAVGVAATSVRRGNRFTYLRNKVVAKQK